MDDVYPPDDGSRIDPQPDDAVADRSDRWDVAGPGVLAFRLEQSRQRYADLRADLRAAQGRIALLLAAALLATPLAASLALTPLSPWFDSSVPLLTVLAVSSLLAPVFLLGALLDLIRALPTLPAANPYRMDELGHPERYLTPGDRSDFASSIDVLRYRQIQRLRPAVSELETVLAELPRQRRRGVAQLVVGLFLLLLPALISVVLPSIWPL